MRMPFGKFAGLQIEDVPPDYLRWLSAQDWLREPVKSAVNAELRARRVDDDQPERSSGLTLFIDESDIKSAVELITCGRKAAALKHHPDRRGGSLVKMQSVNAVADRLIGQLRLVGGAR